MGNYPARESLEGWNALTPPKRPWWKRAYESRSWVKQIVDQAAHAILGALVLWPAAYGALWASAGLVGLLREIEQMRVKRRITDPWWKGWSWHWRRSLDVAGWILGGALLQWAI